MGSIIEELNSDNEKDEPEAGHAIKDNNHMYGRELNQTQHGNQFSLMHDTHSRPQAHSFTFQSSTITYGGSNGAYYTSSTTKRADSDGVCLNQVKPTNQVVVEPVHFFERNAKRPWIGVVTTGYRPAPWQGIPTQN